MQNLPRQTKEQADPRERYHELYDFAPVSYLILDTQGRIIESNRTGVSLLGVGRRDILKRYFSSFLTHDSQPDYQRLLHRLQETGDKQTQELQLASRDRTLRYLQVEALLRHATPESEPYIYLALVDITKHKQAELEFHRSQAWLSGIITSAMDAIICMNESEEIVLFNEAAERMFLRKADETLGKHLDTLLPERFRMVHHQHVHDFGQTGTTNRSMNALTPVFGLRANGDEFPIEATISQVKLEGEPLFTVILRDITERVQLVEALKRSEEFVREIFNSLTDHVAILNPEGIIIAVNAAWLRFHDENTPSGCTPNFVGMNYLSVCEKAIRSPESEGAATAYEGIRSVLDGRQSSFSLEYPCHWAHLKRWFQMTVTPMLGGTPGAIVSHTNITERKLSEEMTQNQTKVLIKPLHALKSLPEMGRFLEQLMDALIQWKGALSSCLWLYDESQQKLSLELAYESSSLHSGIQWDAPSEGQGLPITDIPSWEQLLHTHQPIVVDNLEELPASPYREWCQSNGVRSVLFVPMLLDDKLIGIMSLKSATTIPIKKIEMELIQGVAQQATLTIHMSRLAGQAQKAAILQERNRFAQDIHDTLAQGFTGILLQLQAATYAPTYEQSQTHIVHAQTLAQESLQEARRSVNGLRAQLLEEKNLSGALAHLVHLSNAHGGIEARLDIKETPYGLPQNIENHLFRIAQEALSNALKHAAPTSIDLTLSFEPTQLQLTIRDDGKGFEFSSGFQHNGFGLIGMYERAEQIGGQLSLVTSPGNGTLVTVVLPITSREEHENKRRVVHE